MSQLCSPRTYGFLFYIYSEIFLIDYLIVDVYPEKKPSYPEIFRILIEEDIGIEPNTLTGTSRLAGGPYRHQGLSSVVLIIGLEPITSDVSGRRSHQLSYMSGCIIFSCISA